VTVAAAAVRMIARDRNKLGSSRFAGRNLVTKQVPTTLSQLMHVAYELIQLSAFLSVDKSAAGAVPCMVSRVCCSLR